MTCLICNGQIVRQARERGMSTNVRKMSKKCPRNVQKLSKGAENTIFGLFLDIFCLFGRCSCLMTLSNARPLQCLIMAQHHSLLQSGVEKARGRPDAEQSCLPKTTGYQHSKQASEINDPELQSARPAAEALNADLENSRQTAETVPCGPQVKCQKKTD